METKFKPMKSLEIKQGESFEVITKRAEEQIKEDDRFKKGGKK